MITLSCVIICALSNLELDMASSRIVNAICTHECFLHYKIGCNIRLTHLSSKDSIVCTNSDEYHVVHL